MPSRTRAIKLLEVADSACELLGLTFSVALCPTQFITFLIKENPLEIKKLNCFGEGRSQKARSNREKGSNVKPEWHRNLYAAKLES